MAIQSGRWNRSLPAAVVGVMLVGAMVPAQVDAQERADAPVPEVVVTAQRSTALASRTPVALTVLSGDQLQDSGLSQPSALGERLPNVRLDGGFDGLRITIRGVSNADTTEKGDPSAAFMLDGIYIARPQSQNLSFFDLARVEVLRGPQGTLYGRNATAGVVNVIANAPGPVLEGAGGVELGKYGSRKATAMLNVPVNASLALRGALASNRHDSYLISGRGPAPGLDRDDVAARLSARLALGADASLLLRYDRSTLDQNNDSFVPASNFYSRGADGGVLWKDGSTRARLTNSFVPPNAPLQPSAAHATTAGLAAQFDWTLGALSLHYLGARRSFDHDAKANFHYQITPAVALGVRESFSGRYRQDSHEVRIATAAQGPWTAQAGVYYFREESSVLYRFRDLQALGLPPYYVFPNNPTVAVGKALFGQATYALGARLRATAGVRYSDDDKSRVGSTNFQQAETFNPATDLRLLNAAVLNTHKTTWRLGLEADLAPATMVYGAVSTGYKSGGFNDGCLAGTRAMGIDCPSALAVPASALFYQPETLTSWEAGIKTRFWDRRATLNASAFYYDYSNLQLSGVVVLRGAPRFITTNAGQARVKGLEVEGQASLLSAGKLSYALALLDAHYASYLPDGAASWAGRKLDRSPSAVLTLGYEHRLRLGTGELKAGILTRASRAHVIGVPSKLLVYRVPGRTESELTLGYRPGQGNWSLHAYGRNLENKVRPIAIDSFGMVVPSDPLTWGVRLDYAF